MATNRILTRILLLTLVVASVCLAWFARWYLHFSNYTGLVVVPSLQVVRIMPASPAAQSGIRPGDRLLEIDGHAFSNFSQYRKSLQDRSLTGRDVEVTVDRSGEVRRFALRVESYPVVHLSLFGPGCGLLILGFGLYVYLKKPQGRSTELYLLLTTCLFVLLSLSNHILKQIPSPWILLFWGVALIVVVPVNLHFYLIFPEPKALIRERTWTLAVVYLIPFIFLVCLVHSVVGLDRALKDGTDPVASFRAVRNIVVAYFFVGLISCVAFVSSLVHSFFAAESAERRRQVQVVLIGALTTFMLAVPVTFGLLYFLTDPVGTARLPGWVFSVLYGLIVFTTVILPVSMAVAILRYRLWDLDMAISQSLNYMGVTVVLIALYFFILGLTGWLFGRLVKPSSNLAVLVFTLTVAAVAEPLRRFVKRVVDRTFNREILEYRETLGTFSRELVTFHQLEDLIQRLCDTVHRALGADNMVAAVRGLETEALRCVKSSSGVTTEDEHTLVSGARILSRISSRVAGTLDPEEFLAREDLPPEERPWLESVHALRFRLLVPLLREQRFLGWIALREKKSEALYSSQDRELLETMGNQAAVAIDNALAFETIQELNRALQAKVEKVEEQQSEILRLQDRLLGENRYFKDQIQGQYDFTEIVGAGHGLREVMKVVGMGARSDATVLITGETGTGKELIARAIHFNSERKSGPFIRVNCAALAEGLLLSELFGHEKGAFTGAHERRLGRFELAEGGSIFLDEVGEISANTQVSLLRVLQEREFERVGGNRTLRADVRVIAATNRDLEEAVRMGGFRLDLYYRLKVIPVEVPPLRERGGDIFELALHFVDKYARKYGKKITGVTEEVMDCFKVYSWPGNVREMENVIERSVVINTGTTLEMRHIPMELRVVEGAADLRRAGGAERGESGSYRDMLEGLETKKLLDALQQAGGNKSRAARSLGLKRSTFFNKLKRYGLLE